MATTDNILENIACAPCYREIKAGRVDKKCPNFSEELQGYLLIPHDPCTVPVPTIRVTGNAITGSREHTYLFCKTTDQGILLVDPTAGQFLDELRGEIYIGTRANLLDIARRQDPDRNWDEIWSETPALCRNQSVVNAQKLRTVNVQKLRPVEEFYAEWGSTGTRIVTDPAIDKAPIQEIRF